MYYLLLYFIIGVIVNSIFIYRSGKYLTLGDLFVSAIGSISWPIILMIMLSEDVMIFDGRKK